MKAETKIKLSQLGFTTLEINSLEQLPDLIKLVNEIKDKQNKETSNAKL